MHTTVSHDAMCSAWPYILSVKNQQDARFYDLTPYLQKKLFSW